MTGGGGVPREAGGLFACKFSGGDLAGVTGCWTPSALAFACAACSASEAPGAAPCASRTRPSG